MNLLSMILAAAIAAAFVFGIYRTVKRKGRCAMCEGSCPGCRFEQCSKSRPVGARTKDPQGTGKEA